MEPLVEDLHRVVLDVEVAGRPAEIGGVQQACPLFEADHTRLVKRSRRRHDQVAPLATQLWVVVHLFVFPHSRTKSDQKRETPEKALLSIYFCPVEEFLFQTSSAVSVITSLDV